jgi:phosphatidylglycerophosphatase A
MPQAIQSKSKELVMTTSNNKYEPNLGFLCKHPQHILALGFGSGLFPKAPGTVGTLVGVVAYGLIAGHPIWMKLTIIAFLFIIGISICGNTAKALGIHDHSSIVWDEIVAMMLVLAFTPPTILWWSVAFILFRLFDIWKPFPIKLSDQKIQGGFGVMFDDLLAAIYAILLIQIGLWLTNNFIA